MQLYMYISIAVVLLSTVVLFIIFQRNHLKDLRYRIGLVLSALLACAGSLLFPGLVAVFSANPALRFFIVFFLSILIYILVLFFVLILVFQLVSKDKVDNLIQKWEDKKQERKNARELKLHSKEAEISKADTGLMPDQGQTAETGLMPGKGQAAGTVFNSRSADEGTALTATPQQSPVEPPIEEPYADASIETDIRGGTETAKTPETQSVSEQPVIENTFDNASIETDTRSGSEAAKAPENQFAPNHASELSSMDHPEEILHPETIEKEEESTEPVDSLALSSVDLQDNPVSSEKIVDTSDIIDKMGIDVVTDSAYPVPDQQGNSLTEIIKKAFLLKQQGNVMEAAVLYMTALDQKPDNETAFWIVLDICAIYKITGHADLAEDILLTYIDAFEHLMSEELKDQILQSLYEG